LRFFTHNLEITNIDVASTDFWIEVQATEECGTKWSTWVTKDELRYFNLGHEFNILKWKFLRKLYLRLFAYDTSPEDYYWTRSK